MDYPSASVGPDWSPPFLPSSNTNSGPTLYGLTSYSCFAAESCATSLGELGPHTSGQNTRNRPRWDDTGGCLRSLAIVLHVASPDGWIISHQQQSQSRERQMGHQQVKKIRRKRAASRNGSRSPRMVPTISRNNASECSLTQTLPVFCGALGVAEAARYDAALARGTENDGTAKDHRRLHIFDVWLDCFLRVQRFPLE